jgi:hypothetical protein
MVIVSSAKPNQPVDAAVIYDDADRFGTTWSAMMQTLNQELPVGPDRDPE